jgi:tetratricopeptide (TPR) repeat protein
MDPELFEPQVAIEEPGDLAEGHAIRGVVAAFRQGIEEQVSSEDFDTHYNLAIAYKEMGLVDEAIGEFQFAAKSDEFFTRCCSMLGICFHEKGMNDLAIQWYARGLEKAEQGEGQDMTLGLRYDLAVLHQDNGDSQRALELFTAVYGVDAAYRDVPQHIRQLRQSLGQS